MFHQLDEREQVELCLPLPPGTSRRDLVVLTSARSLSVRHQYVGLLLEAAPLAKAVVAGESTWYIDGPMLHVVLVKQDHGLRPAEQYWDGLLTAPGGVLECHLSPRDVAACVQRRERELEREAAERVRQAGLERARSAREAQAAAPRAEEGAAAAAGSPSSWLLDNLPLVVGALALLVGLVRLYLLTAQRARGQDGLAAGGGRALGGAAAAAVASGGEHHQSGDGGDDFS